jgi:glyoxylase-like metal-dependent hydrolase (beta-lactamase superfamily II)
MIGMCCGLALAPQAGVLAQDDPYTPDLLASIRSLAEAIPGELPTSVGYVSVQDDSAPASNAVEGAPTTKLFDVNPAFQVRYPHGWIMVDAGYDQAASADIFGHYHADHYAQIVKGLLGARLIVVTHEHGDHIGSLLQRDLAGQVAFKTILTKEQVETLLHDPRARGFDEESARRFLVIGYRQVLPIAPGVVLVRAPGHTPGSQLVYVKLASGREVMLIGDVVWRMIGLELQHQKPDSLSAMLGEDRTAIAREMAWLKNVVAPSGVAVVVSHDGSELHALVRDGVLREGFDFTSR